MLGRPATRSASAPASDDGGRGTHAHSGAQTGENCYRWQPRVPTDRRATRNGGCPAQLYRRGKATPAQPTDYALEGHRNSQRSRLERAPPAGALRQESARPLLAGRNRCKSALSAPRCQKDVRRGGRSSFCGDYRPRPAPCGDFRRIPVRDVRRMKGSRRSTAPTPTTEDPDLQVLYGSDGTRTRDLRRDRPRNGESAVVA
jgi:hypothetical protein